MLTTYVDITERRQTEEALREAEARFRSAFDDAAVGMALVAPSGRWLQVNHALCKLLGYSEQELLAGTFQDITHPDDLQANLDNVRQALDGAVSTYQMQKRYIHKSGRLVWALLSVSLIRNGQGEPLYFVSQIQDITGRHEMEQALRESAARYRQMFEEAERLRQYNATILEVMAEGLAMEDADGRLTFVNPKLLSMLDYTAEELVGQPWTLITAPDERERVAEQASQRRGGVTSLYETRLLAKDGQEIPVLVSATPLLQDGRFAGTLATFMDIAERKRAEAALASSERRFRALVTQAPVGIFEIDIGSGCLFANERWLEMTGLTLPAALGQGWVSALHPDDRDQVLAEWRTAAAAGREFKLEYRLQTPQGKATWVFGSALAIRDEHGKVTGYFGTLTDITERRQNEAALRNMNDQLTVWLAELEQRNKEIALLNRMSELLQSCATVDEACAIIASLAPQLFPEGAGGLCVMHPSHDKVEMVAAWGGAPATQPVFAPDDCWALRRSRPHLVQAGQGAPYCRHVTDSSPATHLCVPLLAQGEALGILYLGRTPMADAPQAEAWQRLAQTVGDNIGLALANLILRETLRNQSIRDPLTGLFNRRYMEESLDRELHRAARSLYPVGIIMLDLDHFKHFNDTFGHAAGDAVLRELGAFLQAHVRGGDIVCRYGGEEFTLILPEAPLEATQGRAQLLCQDIHHFHVEYSGQPLGPVTISAGVAAFPDHGQTAEEVLRAADGALYRAKRGGRDRVMIVE